MTESTKEPLLNSEQIQKLTFKRTKKYKKLSFLEQFAMYMGVAQLLEMALKQLLSEKYDYKIEELEKWTLGRTVRELEKNKLRDDFINLLKYVVEDRNYIAHELLGNNIISQSLFKEIIPKGHYRKEVRRLHKAIIEIEQIMVLFNLTNENNCWE